MTNCLLIDDDLDDHDIFLMALTEVNENIGFTALQDCRQAIEKLKTDTAFVPNFIFLDVNMPRLNGIQCLEEIKKCEHLGRTKVIMYSTTSDERMIEKATKLGAAGFLIKPPGISQLVESLSTIFESK